MFTLHWLKEWWRSIWRSERKKENDIGCTSIIALRPASFPLSPLSPACPRLDEELILLLPPMFLTLFNMLPIERREGRVIFACQRPLTSDEIEYIKFCTNRNDFDFVWDPVRYPDIYAHFDELVAHYSWEPYTVDAMFATE